MRLTTLVAEWIGPALERHSGGDPIMWDLTVTPTPNGVGLAVIMFMPGPVLGSVIHSTMVLPNPLGLNEEGADSLVRSMVEALRVERTKQLNQVPMGNGNGGPHTQVPGC